MKLLVIVLFICLVVTGVSEVCGDESEDLQLLANDIGVKRRETAGNLKPVFSALKLARFAAGRVMSGNKMWTYATRFGRITKLLKYGLQATKAVTA